MFYENVLNCFICCRSFHRCTTTDTAYDDNDDNNHNSSSSDSHNNSFRRCTYFRHQHNQHSIYDSRFAMTFNAYSLFLRILSICRKEPF